MRNRIWIGIAFFAACLCAQIDRWPVPQLHRKPDLSGVWQVQEELRGFNDLGWLDARGTGHSEELPKTFTKPITFSVVEELLPATDLFKHYCPENEKDDAHAPAGRSSNRGSVCFGPSRATIG